MAKKLKWKNPEDGLHVSGDFRVVRRSDGKWDLWHGGSLIEEELKLKKDAQNKAQETAALYKDGGGNFLRTKGHEPFIMFDVMGEVAVGDGHIAGIVKACGSLHQFVAIRVRMENKPMVGEVQVPDCEDRGRALESKLRQLGVPVAGDGTIPTALTTVRLIGYEGEWVMALLPFVQGD